MKKVFSIVCKLFALAIVVLFALAILIGIAEGDLSQGLRYYFQ